MAMAKVLERMERDNVTVHGFRSSFRDWAAEQTAFASEVVEKALAHTIRNDVEAAYRRGDLLEKRRQLLRGWESHCAQPRQSSAEIVPLRAG
jgi:integrase